MPATFWKKAVWLIFLALPVRKAEAFSVLTHEALIDANWEHSIRPLLHERYPQATEDELRKAKAYAYGGAVTPDMGYYPLGSHFFTDLLHYVRSGDFVHTALAEAKTLNEYAFALGLLSHYMADTWGHPLATNRSVPLTYPKTRKKFGNWVTYAEDKTAHLRMEFGFDVLQTGRGNYASAAYHDFIGFALAEDLLARSFQQTYGLELKEVFPRFSWAVGTFRWSVRSLFPEMTKAAWLMKRDEIRKTKPGARSRDFTYRMHRKDYFREFGRDREKTDFFTGVLVFFIRVLPKVGPLKALKFKTPPPQAETYFVQSFDTVLQKYYGFVENSHPETNRLPDRDFDTGRMPERCEYPLADAAYCELIDRLKKDKFRGLSPALRQNIVSFYQGEGAARELPAN